MKRSTSVSISTVVLLAGSFILSTSPVFAADSPQSNPMQEQTVGGGYQQRAGVAAAPTHPSARNWAPKAYATCTRGRVQIKLTSKTASCPQGFVRS